MSNPFNGVLINGVYYGYLEGSYSRSRRLKNSIITAQGSRITTPLGLDFPSHSVGLNLDTFYSVYNPVNNNILGNTTYMGVSRLSELETILGALGPSLPLIFVCPDGSTHIVVPIGSIDASIAYVVPQDGKGIEYRVNLTLENIQ